MTSPDVLDNLCGDIIRTFDQKVRLLYDPEDLARGYLQAVDRQGVDAGEAFGAPESSFHAGGRSNQGALLGCGLSYRGSRLITRIVMTSRKLLHAIWSVA